MSMTYTAFVTHITTFLWRQNDADLLASMDNLILMAETELSRKLKINTNRELALEIQVVGNEVTLPTNFKHIISLNSDNHSYAYVPSSTLMFERTSNKSNIERPFYTTIGNALKLAQTYVVGTEGIFTLVYRLKLPSFKDDDTSWLADDYLDLLTYAVLKHTAPFLRNDERVPVWDKFYTDALDSVLEENAFSIESGSPLNMSLPRAASPVRKNSVLR